MPCVPVGIPKIAGEAAVPPARKSMAMGVFSFAPAISFNTAFWTACTIFCTAAGGSSTSIEIVNWFLGALFATVNTHLQKYRAGLMGDETFAFIGAYEKTLRLYARCFGGRSIGERRSTDRPHLRRLPQWRSHNCDFILNGNAFHLIISSRLTFDLSSMASILAAFQEVYDSDLRFYSRCADGRAAGERRSADRPYLWRLPQLDSQRYDFILFIFVSHSRQSPF